MKKWLLSVFVFVFVAGLSAQSLEIAYNGQVIDSIVEVTVTDVENFQTFYFDIANVTDRSIEVLVKKETISALDGASSMFCFNENCFDSDMPAEVINIGAFETFSYENNGTNAFHTTYYAAGKFGKSVVKYTFTNKMVDIDTVSVVVIYNSESAGVASADPAETFAAYPNPTTGKFSVSIPGNSDNSAQTLQIFNETGALLESIVANSSETSVDVDITNYPSGIYFINFQDKNRKRFIKIQKIKP